MTLTKALSDLNLSWTAGSDLLQNQVSKGTSFYPCKP